MPSITTARQVALDVGAQTLAITWTDGHESIYPLDGLRRACPCAHCRGGHARMGGPPDPSVLQSSPQRRWERVQVEQAGSYALRFTWDDGHNTGIYTWRRLRALCPCATCTGSS